MAIDSTILGSKGHLTMKMVCLQMIIFLYLFITYVRISLMIAVVEKCKENKEEARFLLESAPLEGFDNADFFLCWSGKQI